MRMVTCPLDAVVDIIRAASPEDAGGERVQAKLIAKLGGIGRTVVAAGDGGPRARPALRRAVRQLNGFVHAVERGVERGTIRAWLGERVLAEARLAVANLSLIARRG